MSARQYESLRRYFDEAELAAMHEDLVQAVGEVKMLRDQKAAYNSTVGAAIKTAERTVWNTQEKLTVGYESVEVEIIAVMDTPRPGLKRIVRVDSNETVREEPMTPRERQQSFGFQEPEA
jgi:hypothetical protein